MKRRKANKSYWPALILTVIWWLSLAAMVWWVDPEVVADFPLPNTYLVFFLLTFLAIFFLVSLLLENSRRGFLVALWIVILGYIRLWGLWGAGQVGLITGALVAFELYFSKTERG